MENRVHNSKKIITRVLQKRYNQGADSKPHGFWYSIGDSWQKWCEAEMPEWIGLFNYQLDTSNLNVLRLNTKKEILDFHEKFKSTITPNFDSIDWSRVEHFFDGIEIAPYQHELRHDRKVSWYYTWDFASGCIWNVGKIKFNLINHVTERN